jgi:hypothetical protein
VIIVLVLSALVFLFSLVTVVSYFWFVVLGFKRSVLWGLGLVFLQPITTIVYAVKHWDEARRPTFVWLTGVTGWVTCFILTIVAGIASSVGETEVVAVGVDQPGAVVVVETDQAEAVHPDADRRQEAGSVQDAIASENWEETREQIVAEIANGDTAGDPTAADEVAEDAEEVDGELGALLAEVGRRTADGYLTVSLTEAERYLGDLAKLVQSDGTEYHGLLVAVNPTRVLMERPLGGGTFTVEFETREIASLAVLPKP